MGGVAKVESELGGDDASGTTTTTVEVTLELDPADVNDIIRALREIGFARFIVL